MACWLRTSGMLTVKYAAFDVTNRLASPLQETKFCGGFANIYQTSLHETHNKERKVAIKCLRVCCVDLDKRLNREVFLWSSLQHKNILPFLGIAEVPERGMIGIVSPWMENSTLTSYVHKYSSTLSIEKITELLRGVALGFEYLHQLDIVHADPKGDNVLINADGVPMLSDFGNSRRITDYNKNNDTSDGVGSVRWMARELIEHGESPSKASDVWGFGMICYEVHVGKMPYYQFQQDQNVVNEITTGSLPAIVLKKAVSGLEAMHILMMERTWNNDASKRPTMLEILNGLDSSGCYVSAGRFVRHVKLIPTNRHCSSVAISPDGLMVASGTWDGIELWDSRSGKSMFGFMPTTVEECIECHDLCFSQDGCYVAALSANFRFSLWDAESGQLKLTHMPTNLQMGNFTLGGANDPFIPISWLRQAIAFSEGGQYVSVASSPRTMQTYELSKGRPQRVGHVKESTGIIKAISPNGRMVITVNPSSEGGMQVRCPVNNILLGTIPTNRVIAYGDKLLFTSNSQRLIHFFHDDSQTWVQTWDVQRFCCDETIRPNSTLHPEHGPYSLHQTPLYPPSFTRDGSIMLLGTADGFVTAWDTTVMNCVWKFQAHVNGGVHPAISCGGDLLATVVEGEEDLRLWHFATQEPPIVF